MGKTGDFFKGGKKSTWVRLRSTSEHINYSTVLYFMDQALLPFTLPSLPLSTVHTYL